MRLKPCKPQLAELSDTAVPVRNAVQYVSYMTACRYVNAGGLAQILQHAEAAKGAEQPIDEHQLRAQARQAEKAAKAGRDRKATRRDAQEAQTETVAGVHRPSLALLR